MGISTYAANKILSHLCGQASWTMPSTVYLGLYTAAPSDAGGGTEVSGNGYARSATTFGAAASRAIENSSQEVFTAAGGAFGTVVNWGLFDAPTGGNLLWWGTLDAPETINDGGSLTLNVGDLDVSLAASA